MALQEELESAGNWLFRWRSYVPLLPTLLIFIALRDYHYPGHSDIVHFVWETMCFMTGLLGLGIRVFTVGHTPSGTSGRNTQEQVAESLNTTGIYSCVRNPLYLGNFFMGLGIAMFVYNAWVIIVYTLLFWLYHERIIFAEEAFLRKKFGETYLDWANQTPAFIPSFNNYRKPSLSFSVKTAISREANSYIALVILLSILDVATNSVASGSAYLSSIWLVVLEISFAFWLVVRAIRKLSNFFYVEGR